MNWLWLNVPLMAVFFLAITGIPLWLVYRHPDTGPAGAQAGGRPRAARPAHAAAPQPLSRELAGAGR